MATRRMNLLSVRNCRKQSGPVAQLSHVLQLLRNVKIHLPIENQVKTILYFVRLNVLPNLGFDWLVNYLI